jgi:membrane-bound inhibitor of C-type lysozyme
MNIVRRLRVAACIGLVCLYARAGSAKPVATPAPPLPDATQADMVEYSCAGGKTMQVVYWSTPNGQSFALVPIGDAPLLFVETLAASGVRYQAGAYTWWAKGPQANLYDARNGADAAPVIADCNGAS